jgi:hypothetical protein
MDVDDVLVADGGGAGLAGEALAGRAGGGQGPRQHLDRDDALQLGVARAQDDTYAAAADDFQDLVAVQPAQRTGVGRRGQEGEARCGIFLSGSGDRQLLRGRYVKESVGLPVEP